METTALTVIQNVSSAAVRQQLVHPAKLQLTFSTLPAIRYVRTPIIMIIMEDQALPYAFLVTLSAQYALGPQIPTATPVIPTSLLVELLVVRAALQDTA